VRSLLLPAAFAVGMTGLVAWHLAWLRHVLHLYQLEHYEWRRLVLVLRRRGEVTPPLRLSALAVGAAIAGITLDANWLVALGFVALSIPGVASTLAARRTKEKKPLVLTGRASRLAGVALLPLTGSIATGAILVADDPGPVWRLALLVLTVALVAAVPMALRGANALLAPLQRRINRRFTERARARLARVEPFVVAVTGSAGKTTTKVCVGHVLGAHGPTLVTPGSFNSFLGVTRTVNESLSEGDRFFVVEMGAYRPGDIQELCELVRPRLGLITGISLVHLERFGTLERIRKTKGELLESLPRDGHFVTNGDDPLCLELARRAHVPVTLFGVENGEAEVRASNITLSGGRSSFTLHVGSATASVSTQLLGRHNVRNLLAAAACGLVVGIEPREIARRLEMIAPPPHRLCTIVNEQTGVVVIDDAWNANPEGAAAALEVLASHPGRRRVLVTPGMVELGEFEVDLNRAFGRSAATVCDLVLLVGARQTEPIREGLLEGGLASGQIVVVRDIAEATKRLEHTIQPGDVVLFENDLPDSYSENGRDA
jgi:UDP-N-acetylmuramoyl-tripeptide--D-alanyl-D-alanine ligase